MTLQAGQYVTDGTSVFILDDIRDGNRVGDIVFRPILHDGYIKANGATVKASEYPRLLKFAQDNNLLVDSTAWNSDKSKYVYDSSADTLKVPDAQGRVLQGTADTVKSVEAGIPAISGYIPGFVYWDHKPSDGETQGNAQIMMEYINDSVPTQSKGTGANFYNTGVNINTSRESSIFGKSATVQPPALALIPQIKY